MSKLMDEAFSPEKLHEAYIEAGKSIRFKYAVQNYGLNELKEISNFRNAYYNGVFEFSKGDEFTIHDRGKIRRVKTTVFRDRVPVHSFCQNVLLKELRKYLIYDNCASLKGRGVDMQRDRLRVHLQKYFMKYGTNKGYILKGDFTKFFDNLNHYCLIKSVWDKIPDTEAILFFEKVLKQFEIDVSYMTDEEFKNCLYEAFNLVEYSTNISEEQKTKEKMMPKSVGIGNEVSQICGVYFPTNIDVFVKVILGIKYYGRYMDDFYLISNNKEELENALYYIKILSDSMGLYLNLDKTFIQELNRPIKFLKIKYILSKTGKVTMIMSNDNFVRERRKLRKLKKKMENGEIEFKAIQDQYFSWRGTITRKRKIKGKRTKKPLYSNWKQVHKMDKYYNDLFIKPFISGSYQEECNVRRTNNGRATD